MLPAADCSLPTAHCLLLTAYCFVRYPASMATISGTFLSKVFEGPYRNMRKWIEEMKAFVQGKGQALQRMYFFYTTCPKCAKKYGKNYVALLAQV